VASRYPKKDLGFARRKYPQMVWVCGSDVIVLMEYDYCLPKQSSPSHTNVCQSPPISLSPNTRIRNDDDFTGNDHKGSNNNNHTKHKKSIPETTNTSPGSAARNIHRKKNPYDK
jgi:hypothetical protein